MKIRVFLFVLLASLTMPSAASATIYRLDATSTDPFSFGDFFVIYDDLDADNLFSHDELVTFSGVGIHDLFTSSDSDGLISVPNIDLFTDGDVTYWRFLIPGPDHSVLTGPIIWTYSVSAVSAVPVPAALPLFGTGLALMGFLGWRRKRKVAALA